MQDGSSEFSETWYQFSIHHKFQIDSTYSDYVMLTQLYTHVNWIMQINDFTW